MPTLAPHPRLYASREQLERLRDPVPAFLRPAAAHVAQTAKEYARSPEFAWALNTHNAHLIRARIAQNRIVTLLVRWFQTGEAKYRRAVIEHVEAIGGWEYWSWITWRQNNADPLAIYDLSYGENSATLAIAYDWLGKTLSPAERVVFQRVAERPIGSFLKHTASTEPGKHAWWFGKESSNWNTVCAGGAGMLALTMREHLPGAAEVLRRSEWSFRPYMHSLRASHGAWPEGIGYWNYGMRYAFMYLLSHERATGGRHPLLRQPATRATLWFPLDFCPNGVPSSFGDVNHWTPLPFHYAAAERLGISGLAAALDRSTTRQDFPRNGWPTAAELLVFHPRRTDRATASQARVAKLYKGQDWAVLADRLPAPRLYASIRGGTTKVPHAHRDLLSFQCVVGKEAMIVNLPGGEYLDTTFSPRRWEIFEMTPLARNTLLINGVGITTDSAVTTEAVRIGNGTVGFRLDATAAMGVMRNGSAATFCARVFLMLAGRALLIVDRFELPHAGRVESRMHTYAEAAVKGDRAVLRGAREKLAASWACDVPAGVFTGATTPTTPGRSATVLRWCAKALLTEATIATLLLPGGRAAPLRIDTGRGVTVRIESAGLPRVIRLSDRLRAARSSAVR